MYTKDKNTRITLRLNEEQFAFVKQSADDVGVSPSEFLRMVVNSSMAFTKRNEKKYEETLKETLTDAVKDIQKGGQGRANDETDNHNQL